VKGNRVPSTAPILSVSADGNATPGEQLFAPRSPSPFPGFEFPGRDGRRLRVNRFKAEASRERVWLRLYDAPGARRARAAIALEHDQARDVAAAIHELLGPRA
jgi:hypothetical protein